MNTNCLEDEIITREIKSVCFHFSQVCQGYLDVLCVRRKLGKHSCAAVITWKSTSQ